jgi:5'-methylthioadenosine phosphorylase
MTTLGIIGGTGLYALPGLAAPETRTLMTPFGAPSAPVRIGMLHGTRLVFLARHGEQHTLLPSEINYRANVFALKMLGVTQVISVCAVGSLREECAPGDVVLVDQFFDRTHTARHDTFFGDGVVAHVAFADPVCPTLSRAVHAAAEAAGARAHMGGTYVNMEGPAFSTRAESEYYRRCVNGSVIGMTCLTEAKLAREAELCFAVLAQVTDYDCWHTVHAAVTTSSIMTVLQRAGDLAARILTRVATNLPARAACACHQALQTAFVTPPAAIPPHIRARLAPLLATHDAAPPAL